MEYVEDSERIYALLWMYNAKFSSPSHLDYLNRSLASYKGTAVAVDISIFVNRDVNGRIGVA